MREPAPWQPHRGGTPADPLEWSRYATPSRQIGPTMTERTWVPWTAFGATSAAALLLSALPGTSDVNVWNAWVAQLNEHGLVAGYNAGAGHIIHPPLGLLLLWLSHNVPAVVGIPAHLWPAAGFTGFGLAVWLGLGAAGLTAIRVSGTVWWGVLLQLAFLLNTVVYGYFDIWGIPPLLLALHAVSRERPGAALAWAVLASLVKWQFLLLLPFFLFHALRRASGAPASPWEKVRRGLVLLAPATAVGLITLAFFGPGTALSFGRGLSYPVLSGQALNTGWLLTWAMHLRWPESYGPLEDGLIGIVRTRDTRVLFLVRALLAAACGLVLWRLWRARPTPDNLYRCMLAGYLAFFLFNRGVHENHLAPAMALAGYLAWRQPRWRPQALALAIACNVNMFAFYDLLGNHRWEARRLWGMDYSLPLALLSVAVVGLVMLSLLRAGEPNGKRPTVAPESPH